MKQELKTVQKKKEVAEIQLNDLTTVAIILVVAGLVIAFGVQILGDTQTDMTVDSAEYNATGNAISGVEKLSTKMTTIASVVVGVIIIGLLFAFFRFTRR